MAFLSMPGGWEWIILLFIVLIIFGPGKLPQIGRSLGSAISQFKDSVRGKDESEKKEPPETKGDETD